MRRRDTRTGLAAVAGVPLGAVAVARGTRPAVLARDAVARVWGTGQGGNSAERDIRAGHWGIGGKSQTDDFRSMPSPAIPHC